MIPRMTSPRKNDSIPLTVYVVVTGVMELSMSEHLDAMFYSVLSEEDSKPGQRGQLKEFDFRDPGDLLTWYLKSRHETALRNKRIPEYPTYPRSASGTVGGLYRFELVVGEYFVMHHEAMRRCVLRFEYDTQRVADLLAWFRAVPRYVEAFYPTLDHKGMTMYLRMTSSAHYIFTPENTPGDPRDLELCGTVTPRVLEDLRDVLRSWVVVSELTAELRKET